VECQTSCQRRRLCKRDTLELSGSLTTLAFSGLGTNFLVVLLEGGEILAGLGELALSGGVSRTRGVELAVIKKDMRNRKYSLHALSHIPMQIPVIACGSPNRLAVIVRVREWGERGVGIVCGVLGSPEEGAGDFRQTVSGRRRLPAVGRSGRRQLPRDSGLDRRRFSAQAVNRRHQGRPAALLMVAQGRPSQNGVWILPKTT